MKHKQNTFQNLFRLTIVRDWLAFLLGGSLVLFYLPKWIFTITGKFTSLERIQYICTHQSPVNNCALTIISSLNEVFIPLVLGLLGVMLIMVRRKFVAQLAVFFLATYMIFILIPYARYYDLRALMAISQMPGLLLIQLIFAGIAAYVLPLPSLSSRATIPAGYVRKAGLVLAIVLAVTLLIYVGLALKRFIDDRKADEATVALIQRTVPDIVSGLEKKKVLRTTYPSSLLKNNVSVYPVKGGFKVCGNFRTDQSSGKAEKANYSVSDISQHKTGVQCVFNPVGDEISTAKYSEVMPNHVVTDFQIPTHLSAMPINKEGGGIRDFDPTGMQIFLRDGSPADLSSLVHGSTVSIYRDIDLIFDRRLSSGKIVLEDPNTLAGYCLFLTSVSMYAPTSLCPATTSNLEVRGVAADRLILKNRAGITLNLRWDKNNPPSVTDTKNNKITIPEISEGDTIVPVFTKTKPERLQTIRIQ